MIQVVLLFRKQMMESKHSPLDSMNILCSTWIITLSESEKQFFYYANECASDEFSSCLPNAIKFANQLYRLSIIIISHCLCRAWWTLDQTEWTIWMMKHSCVLLHRYVWVSEHFFCCFWKCEMRLQLIWPQQIRYISQVSRQTFCNKTLFELFRCELMWYWFMACVHGLCVRDTIYTIFSQQTMAHGRSIKETLWMKSYFANEKINVQNAVVGIMGRKCRNEAANASARERTKEKSPIFLTEKSIFLLSFFSTPVRSLSVCVVWSVNVIYINSQLIYGKDEEKHLPQNNTNALTRCNTFNRLCLSMSDRW